MKKFYLSCLASIFLYGNDLTSFPSFQGARGVINTPNSEVMEEGKFEFLYTNQVETLTDSASSEFRDNKTQKNFFLNMGVLPNLEATLQYAYGFDDVTKKVYLSNRIANAKYKIPFIPKDWFSMAVGMQDLGGGNPYIGNKYAVVSKNFNKVRASVGYAKGDRAGSIDGAFANIEYQPLSWLQFAGEYDTKEWNGAIKSEIPIEIGEQRLNLGLMAKSSLDYKDVYFGTYINMPFNNKNRPLKKTLKNLPEKSKSIKSLHLSNISSSMEGDTLYFEYENTLYVYSDIDALSMVLGTLSTSTKAKEIVVTTKKANIAQYSIHVNREEYRKFLKTGKFRTNLLTFTKKRSYQNDLNGDYSDRFKPLLTLQPNFVLIDGSEYSDVVDYTLALQAELSMRLAKGTIVSARYNVPLTMSYNFEENQIFDYRNRNKTKAELDQLLFTQFIKVDTTYPWVTSVQVGKFDKQLNGVSLESGISDSSGVHHLLFQATKLKDTIELDRYTDSSREEKLLSYRYYIKALNSNVKVTGGEFLYGDKGVNLSFERYFSDTSLRFDLSKTKHSTKGTNTLAKVSLSIPFGTQKRIKTPYLDIEGGTLDYVKRKNLVNVGEASFALPHHIKTVNNNFTLEKYYLNNDRFHPAYIKENYNRLRNTFLRSSSF